MKSPWDTRVLDAGVAMLLVRRRARGVPKPGETPAFLPFVEDAERRRTREAWIAVVLAVAVTLAVLFAVVG